MTASEQHTEKLSSLNGQLAYTEVALLSTNLESWERREFEIIHSEYLQEIKDLKNHIALCEEMGVY